MPFTSWSNAIKLRACRYLLHRYLGQFLQEKLTLEQLSIEIASKSSARVSDLNLDVVALNRALDDVKLPFEVLDGFIGSVSLVLPLSTIFSDSTELEISQLEVTLRPKSSKPGKVDDEEFTLDSMLESMTMSTMDLAEQCMKNVENVTETFDEVDTGGGIDKQQQFGAEMFAGVEKFAQAVDVVLGRTKVCFLDTVFRIEHVYDDVRKHGIATEIRIKRIEYRDESLGDEQQQKSGLLLGDTARKRFTLDGIEIFSDQFSDKSVLHAENRPQPDLFHSAIDMSASESAESIGNSAEYSRRNSTRDENVGLPAAMTTSFSRLASGLNSRLTKIISVGSKCHVHVTLQNALLNSGSSTSSTTTTQNVHKMRVQLAVDVPNVYAVFWPNQLHALQMLLDAFLGAGNSVKLVSKISNTAGGQKSSAAEGGQRPLTDGDYGRIEAELRRQFNQRHQDVVVSGAETAQSGGNRLGRNNWGGADEDITADADGGARKNDAELLQQYYTMEAARQHAEKKKKAANSKSSSSTDAATTVTAGARTDVRLKVNSLVVLVHEFDEWIDGKILGAVDFKKQDEKTNNFFDAVADNAASSVITRADDKRGKIAAICDSNHLLMLFSPLIVELTSDKRPPPASTTSSSRRNLPPSNQQQQHFDLVVYASANNVNIWEHIYAILKNRPSNDAFPVCSTVLSFPRPAQHTTGEDDSLYGNAAEPSIIVQFRAQTSNFDSDLKQPNMFVSIQLAPFNSDVDLSLIDRLHVLMNPKSTLQHNAPYQVYDRDSRRNSSGSGKSALTSTKQHAKRNKISLQILAPLGKINVRIPVYDGRAPLERILDESRLKSVNFHPQSLVLELEKLSFNMSLLMPAVHQSTTAFSFACNAGRLLFKSDAASEPLPIVWIRKFDSGESNSLPQMPGIDSRLPVCELRFIVTNPSSFHRIKDEAARNSSEVGGFQKVTYGEARASSNCDVSSTSSNNTDDEFYYPPSSAAGSTKKDAKQPNLFAASRRIVDGEDKGLLYISPSDVETVEQFQNDAYKHARLLIEVVLPQVFLALPEKQFFELFYNRVFNDLFMWEPLSVTMGKLGLTLEAAVLGNAAARAANQSNNLDAMYGSTVTLGNTMNESVHVFREFKRRTSTDYNANDINSSQYRQDNADDILDSEEDDDVLVMGSGRSSLGKKPSKTSTAKHNNSLYYSVHPDASPQQAKLLPLDARRSILNDVAVNVRILNGAAVMRTPAYGVGVDSTSSATTTAAHGEVYAQISSAKIFVVSGYHGQTELQYIFISAQEGNMYSTPRVAESLSEYFHSLSSAGKNRSFSISPPNATRASYLRPILQPSAVLGLTKAFNFSTTDLKKDIGSMLLPEMLRVAIELNFDPFRNVKNVRLALGVAHTIVRHRFSRASTENSSKIDWLDQLIEFFDIQQYPIEGLSWPTTVTELHVDAVDCAILYRPIHLPITCCVFIGRLNISSTIMAEAVSTLLRVVVQDLWVMLSDKAHRRKKLSSASSQRIENSIDLEHDFTCVIEVPHFELETRVCNLQKKSLELQQPNDADDEAVGQSYESRSKLNGLKVPVLELKISNSAVNVRTCSDSFQALCDLLVYCANMGDFAGDTVAPAGQMEVSGSSSLNVPSMPLLNADKIPAAEPPSYATAMMTSTMPAVAPPPPTAAPGIDLQMSDAMQDDYRQQLSSAGGTSASSRAVTTTEDEELDDFNTEHGMKNRRLLSKKRSAQQTAGMTLANNTAMTQSVHPNLPNSRLNMNGSAVNFAKDGASKVNIMAQSMVAPASHLPVVQHVTSKHAVVPLRKTRSSQHKPHRHHHRNHGDDPMIRSAVTLGDEDFCLIDEDLGAGILPKSGQIAVKRLLDANSSDVDIVSSASRRAVQTIKIVDNHFAVPTSTAVDQLKAPATFPCPEERVVIHDMNIVFCIYGGNDFGQAGEKPARLSADSSKRIGSAHAVDSESSPVGSLTRTAISNSSQILHRSRIPEWLRQGGAGRDHSKLLEVHATKIRFQHDCYPSSTKSKPAARQVLLIKTIEIIDRLQSSSINKFLYQYSTSSLPRQTHTNMLEIRALHERPHPEVSSQQECSLKVSLQPLRLNVDQETLLFLRDWGTALGSGVKPQPSNTAAPSSPIAASSSVAAAAARRQRTPSNASTSSMPLSGGTSNAFYAASAQQTRMKNDEISAATEASPPKDEADGDIQLTVPSLLTRNGSVHAFHAALEVSSHEEITETAAVNVNSVDNTRVVQRNDSDSSEPSYDSATSPVTQPKESLKNPAAAVTVAKNLPPATTSAPIHFIPAASSSSSPPSNFAAENQDTIDAGEQTGDGTPTDLNQIYFRSFVFAPEVPIRLDYHGRFRDLVGGGVVGLITGLAQFQCSQLTLKRITHRQGVLGAQRLAQVIAREWLEDIRVNQLSSILQGIGPTHSFVQVLQGVRDLFWMPVEQYRRDGRIITGVQRGANAFTTSTLLAVLELTRGAVGIVQRAAECCFDIMSVGPNQPNSNNAIQSNMTGMMNSPHSGMVLVRSNQDQFINVRLPSNLNQDAALTLQRYPPSDFREGVVTAYEGLRTGMTDYVSDVASQIATEHRNKGIVGAAGVTFRHAQPAVVRTVALVSEAANNMLGGLRNQLQPEARKDDIEKWKFPQDNQQQQTVATENRAKKAMRARRPLTAADLLYSDDEEDENDAQF